MPRPPQPTIRMVSPKRSLASDSMVPSAVERPQPSSAQNSSGVSEGTAVSLFSEAITSSAKVVTRPPVMVRPSKW